MSVISLPDRDEDVCRRRSIRSGSTSSSTSRTSTNCARNARRSRRSRRRWRDSRDEEVFAGDPGRNGAAARGADKSVKQAELETLVASKEEIGEDKPDGDFFARTLPQPHWDTALDGRPSSAWSWSIGSARSIAQVGFTRFEASLAGRRGRAGDRRRAGAAGPRDLPGCRPSRTAARACSSSSGSEAIEAWMHAPGGRSTAAEQLERGLRVLEGRARKSRAASSPACRTSCCTRSPHLLITAVALECGYPASSIRERIYALAAAATASCSTPAPRTPKARWAGWSRPAGRSTRHLQTRWTWASSAPTTRSAPSIDPQNQHERRFLHGAACHGCLLIAETSCEQHNDFLDRALVVSTVDDNGAEFFGLDDA